MSATPQAVLKPGRGWRAERRGKLAHAARWYLFFLLTRRSDAEWLGTLGPGGGAQDTLVAWPPIWSRFSVRLGLVRINQGLRAALDPRPVAVRLMPVPRVVAAAIMGLRNFTQVRAVFRAMSGPSGMRLRKALAASGRYGPHLPGSYGSWVAQYDAWPDSARAALLADALAKDAAPTIAVLVFHPPSADPAALQATLASLAAQWLPPSAIVVHNGPDRAAPDGCDYVAVLQAGEILPPHALALMARQIARLDRPAILMADEDRLRPDGVRADPSFKPHPNLTLMCSGVLSRGLWLIRPDLLEAGEWAEPVRLAAWFRAAEAALPTVRVPYVLTHRRDDTQAAPVELLAETVRGFLARAAMPAEVTPAFPLRVRRLPGALASRKVSLLVPSQLRGGTQLACIADTLARTRHAAFEMLVLVMQDGRLDAQQARVADRLQADRRVRVEVLRQPSFNYSAANNAAAALTDGDFLCLMNDDVAPLQGDWLDRMVAFFTDPAVGVVGARLLYPNLTVQHGGVILGLGGPAGHASRFLPRQSPGYLHRARLDQEMSAVTGACLLVRRTVFDAVGGLDESFPTAFNDVDFCLRVRAGGHAVVFAGSVELLHYETLTFGSHYLHASATREAADLDRMRRRWQAQCAADPFHNPNLSLVARSEWELAYPPRLDPGHLRTHPPP